VKRLIVIAIAVVAACKQGKGERCQVMDDCQSPLVCNTATNTCQDTSGNPIDAEVPDGPAGIDAMVDAGSGSGSGAGSGSGSGSGSAL
jgi:hypothetical protein